jgi:hypothetical protein
MSMRPDRVPDCYMPTRPRTSRASPANATCETCCAHPAFDLPPCKRQPPGVIGGPSRNAQMQHGDACRRSVPRVHVRARDASRAPWSTVPVKSPPSPACLPPCAAALGSNFPLQLYPTPTFRVFALLRFCGPGMHARFSPSPATMSPPPNPSGLTPAGVV